MDSYSQQPFSDYTVVSSGARVVPKKFMANVFLWMFVAMAVSAAFSYYFLANPVLFRSIAVSTLNGKVLTPLGWIVIFAPLGFVLAISSGINRFSSKVLILLFLLFAAIMGISLSFTLSFYTATSIFACFAASSAVFGVMAFMGYTTDKDLTSFGRIMTAGLIGIIIASLINLFLHSSAMGYIISIIGVAVFTGLTAYDVQNLKRIGEGVARDGTSIDDTKKIAIMGALTLYLDFINLFLLILRLFGDRE